MLNNRDPSYQGACITNIDFASFNDQLNSIKI